MIGALPGYGAVLHRSPLPLQVVGYYYCNWHTGGPRKELYRRDITLPEYTRVVRRVKRLPLTLKQKDEALFFALKPPTPVS